MRMTAGSQIGFNLSDDAVSAPRAIRDCLEYLYLEAMQHDLRLAAHLIGAASESLAEILEVSEKRYSPDKQPPN